MDRLDRTLTAIRRPGFGVLVFDDYADAALRERGIRADAAADLFEFAVDASTPRASLGGVLASAGQLAPLHPLMAPPSARGTMLGVRLKLGNGTSDTDRSLTDARRVGASFVEIRANRRPGQFPRGEAHVDAQAVAGAAALAQAAGLVPVITVALPGMPGSATGVTRAVIVNALRAIFLALEDVPCDPGRLVLRMPLISPGPRSTQSIAASSVASHTLDVLDEAVPTAVAATWFLSAGHPLATIRDHLAAVAALSAGCGQDRHLGFALGRALLEPALEGWTRGGSARARQQLAAACESAHRAMVPALASS